MEDNFLWFSIVFSLILSVFFILKVGKRFKSKSSEKITSNLPPGPWKLPIFGSIHHLFGSLPHQRMRELSQKYGPLMHLKLGETSTIVVSSQEVAKEVLKTNGDTFTQRPRFLGAEIIAYGCTNIFFSPRGDYWRQLRKICTLELLSAKRVKTFQSIREEEVSKLIRYVSMNTGSTINLTDEISSMTYSIISRASFGDKCNDQEAFILFIKKCMRVVESFNVPNLFPSQHWLHVISGMEYKLKKLHRSGDMLLEKIIKKDTTKIEGSLLSYLLSLKDDGSPNPIGIPLTTNNIKAILQVNYYFIFWHKIIYTNFH